MKQYTANHRNFDFADNAKQKPDRIKSIGLLSFNNPLIYFVMSKNMFIDAEWFISQKMYLIGYAYTQKQCVQLYDATLNKTAFMMALQGVENIYVYGPDVGMLEKYFKIDLRNNYNCFNLLSIIRKLEPYLPSYKLCELEKIAGVYRDRIEYKTNIWQLHKDWMNPKYRYLAKQYNYEDVINLIRVKNYFFQKHGIDKRDIMQYRMK